MSLNGTWEVYRECMCLVRLDVEHDLDGVGLALCDVVPEVRTVQRLAKSMLMSVIVRPPRAGKNQRARPMPTDARTDVGESERVSGRSARRSDRDGEPSVRHLQHVPHRPRR
jgi:hypothetical protein